MEDRLVAAHKLKEIAGRSTIREGCRAQQTGDGPRRIA
jgi:hypothetical protein